MNGPVKVSASVEFGAIGALQLVSRGPRWFVRCGGWVVPAEKAQLDGAKWVEESLPSTLHSAAYLTLDYFADLVAKLPEPS